MDYQYFIEDGSFKLKRLPPSPKGVTVKYKDITNFVGDPIRDYLRECRSIDEKIDVYEDQFYLNDLYEVDVEDFESVFCRNPNKFLEEAGFLKKQYGIVDELIFDFYEDEREFADEYERGWTIIDKIPPAFKKMGIFQIKEKFTDEDWHYYFSENLTIKQIKDVAQENNLKLKHTDKDGLANQMVEYMRQGELSLASPLVISPGPNFISWWQGIQLKYIDELEKELMHFDYPDTFKGAIWEIVVAQ